MKEKTVLIIEDNELNIKLVRGLLQFSRFQLLEAMDAESGIQLARKGRPDLILMDIQLPGMDGLTATRVLKEDAELRKIPIVALTSYAMQGDEDKARQAGCNGYITKPIDTRGFIKTLEFLVDRNKSLEQPDDAGSSRKILIVDDEPLNVKLLGAKLSMEKYTVLQSYNGQEALDLAHREQPDLILLDVMMPGMDGFEVTRRLKSNAVTEDIPIILVTALDGADYKVMGHEAGADEFLNKPVNTGELLARVRSLLSLRDYEAQLKSQVDNSNAGLPVTSLANGDHLPEVVLAVENEKESDVVRLYLQGQPYAVDKVRKPTDILHSSREPKTDLIVVETSRKNNDYLEGCRKLKEKEATQNIQILAIIDTEALEDNYNRLEISVDDFLIRPINIHELRARVKSLIRKKVCLDRLYAGAEDVVDAAITDKLTGLANTSYFMHFLTHELKRATRDRGEVALILLECNNDCRLPNGLGHPAGDEFLKLTSDVIRDNIREVDLGARYGKKCFAVVLPNTDLKGTQVVAERLMQKIAERFADSENSREADVRSINMGIGLYPAHAGSVDELIQKTERALVGANSDGHNRIRACEAGRVLPLSKRG